MTVRLLFSGDITNESVTGLNNDILNIFSTIEDVRIKIFFTSNGGDCVAGEALIETLNELSDQITLCAGHHLESMGWSVFHSFKGIREVSKYFTHASLHAPSNKIELRGIMGGNNEESMIKSHLYSIAHELAQSYRSYLSDKEVTMFLNGGDVVLSRDRVIEVCNIDSV